MWTAAGGGNFYELQKKDGREIDGNMILGSIREIWENNKGIFIERGIYYVKRAYAVDETTPFCSFLFFFEGVNFVFVFFYGSGVVIFKPCDMLTSSTLYTTLE